MRIPQTGAANLLPIKVFRIPVEWKMRGIAVIEERTLEDAFRQVNRLRYSGGSFQLDAVVGCVTVLSADKAEFINESLVIDRGRAMDLNNKSFPTTILFTDGTWGTEMISLQSPKLGYERDEINEVVRKKYGDKVAKTIIEF